MRLVCLFVTLFVFVAWSKTYTRYMREYRSFFDLSDGTKRRLPIVDHGKVSGHQIRIFTAGNGGTLLSVIDEVQDGEWIPKKKKGMWYLSEIRFTCPPLRSLNDQKVKFFSPSPEEVKAGADLQYIADFPCVTSVKEVRKELASLTKLMQMPFACDPKIPTADCQNLIEMTKFLSGEHKVGATNYCEIQVHSGSTWKMPLIADVSENSKDKGQALSKKIEELEIFSFSSGVGRIGDKKKIYEDQKKLEKIAVDVQEYFDEYWEYDDKERVMKLKTTGEEYRDADSKVGKECYEKKDNSYDCIVKGWQDKYGLYPPGIMLDAWEKIHADKEIRELRKKRKLKKNEFFNYGSATQDVMKVMDGCEFDEKVLRLFCEDSGSLEFD